MLNTSYIKSARITPQRSQRLAPTFSSLRHAEFFLGNLTGISVTVFTGGGIGVNVEADVGAGMTITSIEPTSNVADESMTSCPWLSP